MTNERAARSTQNTIFVSISALQCHFLIIDVLFDQITETTPFLNYEKTTVQRQNSRGIPKFRGSDVVAPTLLLKLIRSPCESIKVSKNHSEGACDGIFGVAQYEVLVLYSVLAHKEEALVVSR